MRKQRSGVLRTSAIALVLGAAVFAGCGGSDDPSTASSATPAAATTTTDDHSAPSANKAKLIKASKVELQVKDSEFGKVIFNQEGQVVYAFENDTANTTNCFNDCADFWPPVLADGAPTVADGLDASKVGTLQRPDGATQVTYNGWPLYYMDEPAGEIHCQNMDMHGGLWWVVNADGEPVKEGTSAP